MDFINQQKQGIPLEISQQHQRLTNTFHIKFQLRVVH